MDMIYRRLGKSGLKVSALSFGAWLTFGDRDRMDVNEKLMRMAYDAGINFFDNAEAYADGRAEEVMGEILKRTGWRRDSYIVSSKVFFGIDERKPTQRGLSRKHLFDACNGALQRFQLDYIDLFFCHRPDPEVPIEETVLVMNDLIRQGKILYWGTSEWSATQIQEAVDIARDYRLVGPTMEQPQYNLMHRHKVEQEFAQLYERPGIGTTVWSPLASGVLTGKYNDGVPEGSRLADPDLWWLREMVEGPDWSSIVDSVRKFGGIAKDLDIPQATLALTWCLKNPHVSTVILGATKEHQLEENLKSIEYLDRMTPEVMARLDALFPVSAS